MPEENLERQLEQVIDESLEDTTASFKERQQLKDRLLDLFEDLSEEEQKGMLDQVKEQEMSRRSFLKTLGVGAGALGLASTGAGWSIFQPQSQGVSDIDADTVDGVEAGNLGGGAFVDDDNNGIAELDSGLSAAKFNDGEEQIFGSGNDFSIRFDSGNDDLRIEDEINNSDRLSLDRTTGDLEIEGNFTEGSTL